LRQVIDQLSQGYFSPENHDLFRPIVESLLVRDEYLLLADYQSYIDCQDQVSKAFRDSKKWTRMSILNTARIGNFSSDRAIQEYCRDIWKIQPVKIELEDSSRKQFIRQ
ncbi:MAG: glycogen/starch/alpha-glucan phosphorylase, partial [Gloeobacterales cyanobacterium]